VAPADVPRIARSAHRHAAKGMFGTNWPMIPLARALEGLDALALPDSTRAAFLGGNAARVFRL